MSHDAHPPADLDAALDPSGTLPIAFIRQGQSSIVEVFTGPVSEAKTLGDIPLEGDEVIAAVPFGQIRERGFTVIEDDSKLLYLTVKHRWEVNIEDLIDLLPSKTPPLEDIGFDVSDEEYARGVDNVIRTEIGSGEGANFVIRRDYRAKVQGSIREAAFAWLRNLLDGERGAYWTFAFLTEDITLVGASPERHVSASKGTVLMNPISGTYRHGNDPASVGKLLDFLADRKESEELVMVVDEELKMMSAVCPGGGVMRGPYLKPMTRLTHTEYVLEGKTDMDVREILRRTMFAPTVTGSPMGNSCTVIARHEPSGRGYYSGVLARFSPSENGYELDAPILIRTAQVKKNGDVIVSAGATLVRHSDPHSEAQETKAKVSGVLTALGLLPATRQSSGTEHAAVAENPQVKAALQERNRDLAPFWRDEQFQRSSTTSGTVLVIDCDDDFTTMLAHQLRHLGMEARIQRWDEVPNNQVEDLVIFGPGPGDPNDSDDPRIQRIRSLMLDRIGRGEATVAVCLSHQILSTLAGLPVQALESPRQGEAIRIDLLGESSLIGFYNTYAARGANGSQTPNLGLTVHSEPETGIVHSLTGLGVGSVQGHLESVLSLDGFEALSRLVNHALNTSKEARKEPGAEIGKERE